MPVRRAALALAAAALSATAIGLPSVGAQGAPPEVGWWTANQVAGIPIGRAALVPPGGSQVASGADGPVSVAAVRFPAGAGGAAYEVGIELGSDADAATVVACPIVEAWEPVSGGPLADAPAWDCSLGEATGTVDPEAATVTWQLPPGLARDGAVDVILVPTDGAASFTLTMSAPAEDAVTRGSAPTSTTTTSPGSGAPVGPTTTAGPGPTRAPGPVPAPRVQVGPAPTSSAPVGLPSPLPTTTVAPGSDVELAVADAPVPSSTTGRVLGAAVLALVVSAVVVLVRRAPRPASGPGPEGRGVGRFVRPRDEPPPPI